MATGQLTLGVALVSVVCNCLTNLQQSLNLALATKVVRVVMSLVSITSLVSQLIMMVTLLHLALWSMVVAPKGGGKSVALWHGTMQPAKSHSGSDAIAAFDECEFQISRMFSPGEFRISRVHSDCEPSLIGPLAAKLKARGIWPTNTEGYDHNGNAVVEGRNKLVQRGIRSALITATGGRNRYTEVWGTALVHINDCINHTSHAGA